MKRLEKPKQGKIVPIFYKGTLKAKYAELLKVQERIEEISSHRDTSPSKAILDDRGELEIEIDRHLVNGERLEDKFMDFCLRQYNGSTTTNINGMDVRNPSVFEAIPKIKEFLYYVKGQKGQKILSTYEGFPEELGVINGECKFSRVESFRYLNVPTSQLFTFDRHKNAWEKGRSTYDSKLDKKIIENHLFEVNHDIFSSKGSHFFGMGTWSTNYPKEGWIGGGPPGKTIIYIGDEPVQNSLGNIEDITKTETKKEAMADAPI